MAAEKDIVKEIDEISSLKTLTEIYGEIASVRMKKIREFVLKNRDFLSSINKIFQDALAAYAQKLSELVRKGQLEKGGKVTFLAHNGKTTAVLISANTGFYGEVVKETFRRFIREVREDKNLEITIVGRLGRSLFLGAEPNRPYTYFELPDYGVDQEKLSEVIRHLVQYEEIRIYYGRYESVVTQKPSVSSISAGTPISEEVERPEVEYIFEPSVERILMFFETEIFASLFGQSIRESQLAKFASRILAMDRATENIKDRLGDLRLRKLRAEHKNQNRKQLNSLASVVYMK